MARWCDSVVPNRVVEVGRRVRAPSRGPKQKGIWNKSASASAADVVVIGSGIGGLCCGALLARYGRDVVVLESHDMAGGAAHSFEVGGFHFDSGPSLFSPFEARGNPLGQVLRALGESVASVSYESWMVHLPDDARLLSRLGPSHFAGQLAPEAARQWALLLDAVLPLSVMATALPPLALRSDWGALSTAALRYGPSLAGSVLSMGPRAALLAPKMLRPFSEILDSAGVTDTFLRNWLDLLAFLLAGVKCDAIVSAEMIYMMGEWYREEGAQVAYPLAGSAGVVDALLRGLLKFGGRLRLRSHVDEITVDSNGRANGVRLRGGEVVRAREAVVSNASAWDTLSLLPNHHNYVNVNATPPCDSFMHLHLGFDARAVRRDLGIHHVVVNDWARGVDAQQNVVLISIPSALTGELAPPGKHVLHAYLPGTEPYALWEGLDRRSAEYRDLKEERAEVMWRAVERVVGDGFRREACEVSLVGSPLTHQRFLRRHRGTYGPAISAADGAFPGHVTPIAGLFRCGDSTFPGIGVPAVAASGAIVANSLVSVSDHTRLLDAIGI